MLVDSQLEGLIVILTGQLLLNFISNCLKQEVQLVGLQFLTSSLYLYV